MSLRNTGKVCVAYGDCNTEGVRTVDGPVWAELVADTLRLELKNCGHTMSTTRELLQYASVFPPSEYEVVFVQYGLVDSWLTFRGAPYVLYYPDSPRRKVARKLVKKIKKWARKLRLQKRIGSIEQVPLDEYIASIRTVVRSAPDSQVVLVATAPNRDEPRNPRIRKYNMALSDLAGSEPNAVYADAWGELWGGLDECLMDDGTHLTAEGHRRVASSVRQALNRQVFY